MQPSQHINIGIIGLGDWGRNHIRTFSSFDNCTIRFLCDISETALNQSKSIIPSAYYKTNYNEVTQSSNVDAIIISTTSESHYKIAFDALREGKHILVEKPFVLNRSQAEELIELAEKNNCNLMVGHLLLHHPVIREMKKRIDAGEIGNVLYMYSTRINFGKIRSNENALWSFAPHDISTMNYLIGNQPTSVSATGQSFINNGVHDVVFFTMNYSNNIYAHGHVSWLDPHKRRSLTIVGMKKMFSFDDTKTSDKLMIHDKAVGIDLTYRTYGEYMTLRQGDVNIPYIKMEEPLKVQAKEFLSCIREKRKPINNGEEALQVLKVLLACDQSLERNGAAIDVSNV